jgi:hypothetical protein
MHVTQAMIMSMKMKDNDMRVPRRLQNQLRNLEISSSRKNDAYHLVLLKSVELTLILDTGMKHLYLQTKRCDIKSINQIVTFK